MYGETASPFTRLRYRFLAALILLGGSPSLAACQTGGDPIGQVRPAGVAAVPSEHPDLVVLDVRTPREWQAGILPAATGFADWDEWPGSFVALDPAPEPTRPILVYCHSGHRSSAAARWLSEHGYGHVYNLVGGIAAWRSAGLPLRQR